MPNPVKKLKIHVKLNLGEELDKRIASEDVSIPCMAESMSDSSYFTSSYTPILFVNEIKQRQNSNIFQIILH